ncbi:MAG: DUF2027 domain-containing protein, partial [Paludibacteraceae bacterium]|nr:DUF2027 domain-containing protein [Paludibacteraceae bacterium]
MIKIGDKVRFLNAVGGGKVVGFQDKNIVLVEEEDGFETPVLANEIVVVEAGDDMAKAMSKEEKKKSAGTTTQSLHAAMNQGLDDEDEAEIKTSASARPSAGSEDEAPYFTDDLDSADGEKINISLAFMPVTEDKLQNTDFDLYLINDDNYFVSFFISTKDDSSFENEEERWVLREQGTIEPHTRLLLNRITNGHAGDWERINVQAIAFKDKRSFVQKPAFNASLHLSPTRLYKQNAFTVNDYFDRNALVLAVVKDDRQAAPTAISAESIEEAIMTKPAEKTPALKTRIEKKEKKDDILEIDLHIDKLLDDTTGMQPKDILDYQVSKFRQTMEAHKKEKGKRIVFIHGKGEG